MVTLKNQRSGEISEELSNDLISSAERVDLKLRYPISLRLSYRRSFPWIVAAAACVLLSWAVQVVPVLQIPSLTVKSFAIEVSSFAAVILFLIGLATMVYQIKLIRSYEYELDAGNLIISKGIVLRERGCFPLARITDIYLDHTFLDLIFGIYTLHVFTPSAVSGNFAKIDGLTGVVGAMLQTHLISCTGNRIELPSLASNKSNIKRFSRPHLLYPRRWHAKRAPRVGVMFERPRIII